MRRLFSLLIVLSVIAAWADPPDVNYAGRLGRATTDNFKWFASGSGIPGTLGVQTDTMIGDQNKTDTTVAVDIAGAQGISITIVARENTYGADNIKYTMYFQVADSSATAAAWHTLNTTYSASASNGATTFVLALNPTFPDSVYAAQTGMTAFTHGDQAYVRNSRYIRMILDPTAYAADTFEVRAHITKIYPR
uniref:Uncharacterized protein n=1 Tax=viral metagenome TaxID=1070528 RepID=A0A6M3XEY9_9ZZZZ